MLSSRRRLCGVLVGLAWLEPATSWAHTSRHEQLTCPVDGVKFKVTVTGSYTTFGQYRDFAKQGAIGSLYADMVHACPACHFAGYQDDFSKPVGDETKHWVQNAQRRWGKRKLSAAEECEAAAARYAFEQQKAEAVARLYLIGSYLLRGAQGSLDEQRKAYQRAAATLYGSALAAATVGASERGAITYLVAELERRTENFKDALKHYAAARAEPNNPAGLVEWMNEQEQLAIKRDSNNDL
jgi:uncharacterized protein (DUF2225 family)